MNAPAFNTCVMHYFQAERDLIFILTIRNTKEIGGEPVRVTDTNDIYVRNGKTYSDSKEIIGNILAYSTNIGYYLGRIPGFC